MSRQRRELRPEWTATRLQHASGQIKPKHASAVFPIKMAILNVPGPSVVRQLLTVKQQEERFKVTATKVSQGPFREVATYANSPYPAGSIQDRHLH